MRLKVWLLVWLATLFTSLILSQNAFAARVTQVKGKQVLIELEGDAANIGDKYFVMIAEKKRGLVTISKLGKTKAIAILDKGKAEVNATLQLAKAAAVANSAGADDAEEQAPPKPKRKAGMTFGVLGGYAMNSQTAKVVNPNPPRNTESVKMTGSGFSVVGFADIPYSGNLGFIGRGGVQMFEVKGLSANSFCAGPTSNCFTEITYLTLDALIRYNFGSGSFVPFAAAGIGIYYPLSKSTTALSPDIGMSTVFLLNGGFNYHLSKTMYIPVMVEYGLFPPGPDVSTNIISVRGGLGLSF